MNIQRTFIAGDQWLYFKLYSGYKTAEMILRETIFPLSESLLNAGLIDQWFFIRYGDPKYHLRIRFRVTEPGNIGPVILYFNQAVNAFVQEDLIWKIQIDTYQREIERYGNNTMELAEELFFHDSRATVQLLNELKGNESENARWILSMKLIDCLLTDFTLTLPEKNELMGRLAKGFANEFGFDDKNSSKKQMADKYRKFKSEIEKSMTEGVPDPIQQILSIKSEHITPIAQQIKGISEQSTEYPVSKLLESYIHMMMNRYFRTSQRKYELIIYDFMSMYYNSQLKRRQKQG